MYVGRMYEGVINIRGGLCVNELESILNERYFMKCYILLLFVVAVMNVVI